MNCKIMSVGNMEDITERLAGCAALLNALYEVAGVSTVSAEALRGVADLLGVICRDRQADIDCAEDYIRKEASA